MKIRSVQEINDFKSIIESASGQIWAEDANGKEYDLKNELVRYMVLGEVLKNPMHGMEIYASSPKDERRLIAFFMGAKHGAA